MNKAEAVFNKMMEVDYCSQWMQIEPLAFREGYCRIKMTVRKEMLNGYGILHGGIAYAFADSALAFATNSYGRIAVSLSGSMTYAKGTKENEVIIAEATVVNVTHKTAECEVLVSKESSGEVCYRYRGTVYRKSEEILVN